MDILKISLGIALIAVTSCTSKAPEACIEATPEHFKILGSEYKSCTEDVNFQYWLSDNGEAREGESMKVFYEESGNKTVSLISYSDDGRDTSMAFHTSYVGYVEVDSIVVKRILGSTFDPDGPEMYIRYGFNESIETYENVLADDLPLTFTFAEEVVHESQVRIDMFLFDRDGGSDELMDQQVVNPHLSFESPVVISETYFEYEVHWHFHGKED